MNIVVRTVEGHIYVRPDTTWERDNENLFLPPFIDCLTFTPVLFARISKPGRSVGIKFTDRYYDGIGYGILLYPENLVEDNPYGIACASCVDHTSFLPFPIYNKVTLDREENVFSLKRDDACIFSFNSGTRTMIEEAIASATSMIYVRSGDIIALELDSRKNLCTRNDGPVGISGSYCDNQTIDFKIIP